MTHRRRTLPFAEFPRPFQLALRRMETPRRGRRRYSASSLAVTRNAAGQYLAVVQRKGLDLRLSREGLCLFIEDLDARPLKNTTRLTYVTGIQAMAKELRYPALERRLILEDCGIYREDMQREVPGKVRQLAAKPITLRDVALAAVKWRRIAYETQSVNRRRTYFQRSGVLALLSMLQMRISDVSCLVVGRHVIRDEYGWSLQVASGKTGYRHHGKLHDHLTPYLDDLLMFGDSDAVMASYLARRGTPLFSTETNEILSSRTLAYGFKTATGHTPHIVRTLVHDAMAQHGTHGAELARVLCGQTSAQTAKHYEVHAGRYRAQKAQELIADMQAVALKGADREH
ncbi:hypothetical protein [Leisingera sp. ANG-S5]|uniref:hypothetical protein n=1 Tax=Leisingera sp. ANG-S5 TaxID=1577901 RepID=UPI00057D47D9|nr:hypothetical protein [Leisingera sp. ANG-S5]KIC28708.1 hypothetical protein RA25_21080 [Leisingera sp. ANG-S5]